MSQEDKQVADILQMLRDLAEATKQADGKPVKVPALLREEGMKFMRGEKSLFDQLPLGDLVNITGAICEEDTPASDQWGADTTCPIPARGDGPPHHISGGQGMGKEDKPVSEPRLVSYGLNMETCTLNLGGEEYYYDLKATTIDGGKPVAAQEPIAKVRVNTAGGNAGITWTAVAVNDYDSLPVLTDGTLLYANAAPCARCAERPSAADYGELNELYQTAQAKITEQAALIEKMDIENTSCRVRIGTLNAQLTTQADRIKALEAEVSALKEWNDIYDETSKSFIERQRKVIEGVKQFINTPISVESCARMNAAIAELEKGVG